MSQPLNRVCVVGTGSFLPGEPIPNDALDSVLGPIPEAPDRVRSFIETVGRRMLDGSGIRTRHFAIDPETRALTHTVASLGEEAARKAMTVAEKSPADIDLLLISSPIFDRGTPPTSTLLQERLGIETCAEMEIHSNCSGIGKCVQIAYDALRLGRYRTALVVYSQLSSVYLRSCYFNQPKMTKTQAALRYILADGAGALVLEARDGGRSGPLRGELLGTHVESIGGKMPPAMTCGGGVQDVVAGVNPAEAMYGAGLHHLDQDFAAVNRNAAPFLYEGMMRMLEELEIPPQKIDHYIWSIPTLQLYNDNITRYLDNLEARPEQLRFRAQECGYCGGASLLIHFDEIIRSGELQPGESTAVYSVESSKWMSAGFVVRW